jgi:hypothetical protein
LGCGLFAGREGIKTPPISKTVLFFIFYKSGLAIFSSDLFIYQKNFKNIDVYAFQDPIEISEFSSV